jgi:uncharacterized protein YndB with AHSA1/START domain
VTAQPPTGAGAELTIVRHFDAPRPLVFRMWTEADHLKRWCCPTGFTIPVSEGDIRPAGWFKTCMRAPDGADHWLGGRYLEILPPERLVFTHHWLDADGRPGHETRVTVTLAEDGGGTRLTLYQAFFLTTASRDSHEGGWSQTLDSLKEYLSS